MTKKEILNEFKTILKTDGKLAYTYLYNNLSLDDFIKTGIKNPKKGKEVFNNRTFFDELLCEDDYLYKLSNSKIFDELLYFYFTNSKNHSENFLRKLTEVSPKDLIDAVRLSQAFLNEDVFPSLMKLNLPTEFKVHQETWFILHDYDLKIWKRIESNSNELWCKQATSLFLGNLINWLEEMRFCDDSNEMLNQLSSSYNFIISYYLSNNYSKCNVHSEDDLENGFCDSFESPNLELQKSFELISTWMKWNLNVLEPYSFDLNTYPVFNDDMFKFEYYDASEFEKWQKDGIRYLANNIRYKTLGTLKTKEMILTNTVRIPDGKTMQDKEINIELFADTQGADTFLSDLHLNHIKIGENAIETKEILQPLLAYSKNRLHKYEYALEKIKEHSVTWRVSFLQLAELNSSKKTDYHPYFLMTKEEYIELNLFAANEEQKNVFDEIVNQFGYRITEKFRFNRHSIGYNVWYNPFVRLGDFLFCPMMFFARNEWFYSLAQIVIKSYEKDDDNRKKSSIQMEEGLKKLFLKHNAEWTVFIPTFEYDGDIDIIVSDGTTDLLIQLKRTYFKVDLKAAYFEMINSERKGINQLNQGEEFLDKNPEFYRLKETREKWLVSTSLERINQSYEGCRKINYLELIWVLQYKQFNSIEKLKNYMLSDELLNEHLKFIG